MHEPWKERIPTPSKRPKLGQRVQYTAINMRSIRGEYVYWFPLKTYRPREGMYIGYRVMRSGRRYYPKDYGPGQFEVTASVSVALVLVNEKSNPVRVPWADLEFLP